MFNYVMSFKWYRKKIMVYTRFYVLIFVHIFCCSTVQASRFSGGVTPLLADRMWGRGLISQWLTPITGTSRPRQSAQLDRTTAKGWQIFPTALKCGRSNGGSLRNFSKRSIKFWRKSRSCRGEWSRASNFFNARIRVAEKEYVYDFVVFLNEYLQVFELLQNPHIQGLLYSHDIIAQKDYLPKLPEIPTEVLQEDEEEETIKIVQLVKSSEPLVS